jgi:Tfp pilus assembly protein PilF
MSLLLDALRRAEQEKLAKQGERPRPSERERAAPQAPSATPSALELQPVGAGAAPAAAANAPAMPGRTDAESAQNLFKAKAAPAAEPSRKTGVLWAVVGAIVVVIVAVGAYVWYSIEALAPKMVAKVRLPSPPAAAPKPTDFSIGPRLDTPPPASAPKPTDFSIGPRLDTPPPATTTTTTTTRVTAPVTPPVRTAPSSTDQLVMNLLKEAPAAPALKLSQASEPKRVPTEVAAGYEALRTGNLAQARRGYSAALASDPANVDALLGLATVEARGGNHTAATTHYRKVLDLDPRNPTALASLAALTDFARADAIESQLRGDAARYPQSAALRFTLGNLYATQGRWSEAQLEYFEAHRLDPASADIVFNLAVSLDHLGQPRVASEYYRRALAAARTQATQFDPARIERRLAELGFEPTAVGR